ncbi:hypothetical protein EZS27_025176 [termite gut metagenome]|uniref:Uncharacterized protein n=1 Tax=termite gut metagenome TaxID=433724 RepID=A0A5J4QXL1_9ZZZZ
MAKSNISMQLHLSNEYFRIYVNAKGIIFNNKHTLRHVMWKI